MRLAFPLILLLYIPFLILLLVAARHRDPTLLIPSIKPFAKANPGRKIHLLFGIPFLLDAAALALLIFALARPQKGLEIIRQRAEGIDIMIVLDISGSMAAVDIPDTTTTEKEIFEAMKRGSLKTRAEIAKQKIKQFVKRRPNDRIGLIAFAPLPYLASPPTLHHEWLFAHLDRLRPDLIGSGTGIAAPIAAAVHRLKDSDTKRKVVVFFTDGANNVDARITPRQAAQIAKTFDVVIYTIGMGSHNAYVPQSHPFYGRVLLPLGDQFDEKLLRDIADTTGGKYFEAAEEKGLEEVMSQIDQFEKTVVEQPVYVDYKEIGPSLIKVALAMILLSFLLTHTIMMKLP